MGDWVATTPKILLDSSTTTSAPCEHAAYSWCLPVLVIARQRKVWYMCTRLNLYCKAFTCGSLSQSIVIMEPVNLGRLAFNVSTVWNFQTLRGPGIMWEIVAIKVVRKCFMEFTIFKRLLSDLTKEAHTMPSFMLVHRLLKIGTVMTKLEIQFRLKISRRDYHH